MSRAFMKELEDAPEPKIVSAPRSRPMTPAGVRALRAALERETDEERRRALRDELDSAIEVAPPDDRSVVALGAHVTVAREDGSQQTFTIVSEPEMDVASGKITDASPLGKALVGSHAGNRVVWKRPVGDIPLVVKAVRYET